MRFLLIKTGISLNQRQISKFLEVSQSAVMKAIPELEKWGLIKLQQDKESKRWSIELNCDNYMVIQLKGEDIYNSDIDIAVIGRKDKIIDLEEFEKILERKININFYDSFKDIHKNLKENLFNGIVLYGGIEL